MRNMPELRVEWVRTDELTPYEGNAKEHSAEQVEQIAQSIEEFNFADPIAAWHDETGRAVIIEGHGRLMAAEKLGITELPCIFLDYLDDEQRRAYTLVHNQTTLNSGFDLEVLQAELDRIDGIDMGEWGFDLALETIADVPTGADDVPEFTDDRASDGDVWQMGEHRLVCGDATDPKTIERLMMGEEASLVLTDPPYNVEYVGKTVDELTIENDRFRDEAEYRAFLRRVFENCAGAMMGGASFYVWCAVMEIANNMSAASEAGLPPRQVITWIKDHFALSRQDYQWQTEACVYGWKEGAAHYFANTRKETTVIDDEVEPSKMRKDELVRILEEFQSQMHSDAMREVRPKRSEEHPTMKPVALFERLIRNSSRRGDVVLDPFAGSGTTLIACEQMGRLARLAEIDPHYCDVIVQRWEALTGNRARVVRG